MSCHYRIAARNASVGQPEVLLGIIPGAGGTQRLPRLCGTTMALEMCTDGKPISAARALEAGILDRVVDGDLLQAAIAFARERLKGQAPPRTRARADRISDVEAAAAECGRMRATLARTAKGLSAPYAAVSAIEAGLREGFDAGSLRERELFADCVVSGESKALRHVFFAERDAAKVPDAPAGTQARTIARAAVVGAGTMGGGIAMTYANAGIPVLLKEVDHASLDRGLATIRRNYESSVSKGKMTPEALERTLGLITPTTTFDGFHAVDIVVEAVFENMDLKKATFAELGRVTRPDCILASNSSTLDISERPGPSFFQPREYHEAAGDRPRA
jgi:3-hydroxyacyl-CoA dehydrogenase